MVKGVLYIMGKMRMQTEHNHSKLRCHRWLFLLAGFIVISTFAPLFCFCTSAALVPDNVKETRYYRSVGIGAAARIQGKVRFEKYPGKTGSSKLIKAKAGIVMDANSGAVLYGKNIDKTYPPASITKLLTALIVIENSDLDEMVNFTKSAMSNVESDSGNRFDMEEGDVMSVKDALHLLLLQSSNQAANALAEHVAGSNKAFVEMMNQKVAALGCVSSHFDNPSGLNGDTQYVSARDMAVISRAVFANPQLLEISSALKYKMPATINNPKPFIISTEHRMLKEEEVPYYYESAKAGKTGYLIKAGNTLVTYAEQDGKKLISVILKGRPYQYFLDGKALLEFGFDNFDNINVAEQESEYVTGETSVEIDGKSYLPSDLEIDSSGAVTVPKGGTFADLKHSLVTEIPDKHPDRSIAFIQYTYKGHKVGGAYLKTKDVPDTKMQSESTKSKSKTKSDSQAATKEEKGIPVWLILLLILAAFGGGGACLLYSGRVNRGRKGDWK